MLAVVQEAHVAGGSTAGWRTSSRPSGSTASTRTSRMSGHHSRRADRRDARTRADERRGRDAVAPHPAIWSRFASFASRPTCHMQTCGNRWRPGLPRWVMGRGDTRVEHLSRSKRAPSRGARHQPDEDAWTPRSGSEPFGRSHDPSPYAMARPRHRPRSGRTCTCVCGSR